MKEDHVWSRGGKKKGVQENKQNWPLGDNTFLWTKKMFWALWNKAHFRRSTTVVPRDSVMFLRKTSMTWTLIFRTEAFLDTISPPTQAIAIWSILFILYRYNQLIHWNLLECVSIQKQLLLSSSSCKAFSAFFISIHLKILGCLSQMNLCSFSHLVAYIHKFTLYVKCCTTFRRSYLAPITMGSGIREFVNLLQSKLSTKYIFQLYPKWKQT